MQGAKMIEWRIVDESQKTDNAGGGAVISAVVSNNIFQLSFKNNALMLMELFFRIFVILICVCVYVCLRMRDLMFRLTQFFSKGTTNGMEAETQKEERLWRI